MQFILPAGFDGISARQWGNLLKEKEEVTDDEIEILHLNFKQGIAKAVPLLLPKLETSLTCHLVHRITCGRSHTALRT